MSSHIGESDDIFAGFIPPLRCLVWEVFQIIFVSRYQLSEERGASVCSSLWQSHLREAELEACPFLWCEVILYGHVDKPLQETIVIWIYGQCSRWRLYFEHSDPAVLGWCRWRYTEMQMEIQWRCRWRYMEVQVEIRDSRIKELINMWRVQWRGTVTQGVEMTVMQGDIRGGGDEGTN